MDATTYTPRSQAERLIVARKDHPCHRCRQTIARRSVYLEYRSPGTLCRYHVECARAEWEQHDRRVALRENARAVTT